MSSSDFTKVLIRDERLDCEDSIPFAVYRSGSNVTVATFEAISQSASSIVFNVQVPSETTVLDRRVIWEATVDFDVTFTSAAVGSVGLSAVEYGAKQAFCAWPLHSLCNTQQATINNNSVTMNTADILPALQRLHDDRELQRYNGMSPLKPDNYQQYADGLLAINNVLGSALNIAMENDYKPRGAQLVEISYTNVPTPSNIAPATGLVVLVNTVTTYHVRAVLREPLIMSPFLYAHPVYNGQGFYGLQNLNMVFNLNANGVGLWRCMGNAAYPGGQLYSSTLPGANPNSVPTVTNLGISAARLIFNFITPKPSDLLAARNVVPYYEMPRYLKTSCLGSLLNQAYTPSTTNATFANIFPAELIQSQSLQLNQVPDKLIVFFRPSAPTALDTNRSLIVQRISINWNNQSGILASATQDQLWRFSTESGSIQTWEEFSGVLSSGAPGLAVANPAGTGGNVFNQQSPSVGSYLMLDFAKHINITEDYYAPGSLGNFNLQFSITVASNQRAALAQMDMVIITVNSGVFVTEKGQSATYTGILTKDDVLSASAQKPMSDAGARRMVGGIFGSLGNLAKKAMGAYKTFGPAAQALTGALLPDGKIKDLAQKGFSIADSLTQGQGRMRGRGKGSQIFNIQDRLI